MNTFTTDSSVSEFNPQNSLYNCHLVKAFSGYDRSLYKISNSVFEKLTDKFFLILLTV